MICEKGIREPGAPGRIPWAPPESGGVHIECGLDSRSERRRLRYPGVYLRGPEDLGQMRRGDVIVAVAITPVWKPLFAMASAVVTEIGGPPSHSSIVAREYGIPAMMATGVATRLNLTGQMIMVDGTLGLYSRYSY